jgi:hypothetical protein
MMIANNGRDLCAHKPLLRNLGIATLTKRTANKLRRFPATWHGCSHGQAPAIREANLGPPPALS